MDEFRLSQDSTFAFNLLHLLCAAEITIYDCATSAASTSIVSYEDHRPQVHLEFIWSDFGVTELRY